MRRRDLEQADRVETSTDSTEGDVLDSVSRRKALKAVRKYATGIAGTSTLILSADDALAKVKCSRVDPDRQPMLYHLFCGGVRPNPGDNGRGNSQSPAPGAPIGPQRIDQNTNSRFTRP